MICYNNTYNIAIEHYKRLFIWEISCYWERKQRAKAIKEGAFALQDVLE